MKKFLVALTTAGLLVAGGAGVAAAAGSGSGSGSTTSSAHRGLHARKQKLAAQALKIAADKIGVSTADLKAALKSGKSVADVAKSKNVDPADVVTALVHAADTKIDKAVTNNKLSADKAAKLKANLTDRATKLVNNAHRNQAHRKGERYGRRANLVKQGGKIAADTIGVSPQALRTAVKSGKSVAEVATSKGVDPQTVINAIVNAATTKIDQAVTNGKLSADRAATLKSKLTDGVTKRVNAHHGSAQGVNG
jgi:ribosomal protein S20